MKASGYIRTSTEAQAKEGESLRTQSDAIKEYATSKDWDLIEIYEDAGISGAKADRPALARLLDDARQKKFEILLIHRLSRFGRNARDLLNNYHSLKELGIATHFIKENIDSSTPTGRLLFTIMAAIAEMEREIIEEQTHENRRIKWKENRAFIGRLPLGLEWNKKTKEIEIEPEGAKLYKKITRLYLDEGLSQRDIALRLQKEGYKGKYGKPFKAGTISYMLKNPAYYGKIIVNRHQFKGKRRTGELKPEEDWISFDCPPIISKQYWDKIQAKIESNKRSGKRLLEATKKYWLRDILICDQCGGRIRHRPSTTRNDGTKDERYACYWATASQKELNHERRQRCDLSIIDKDEIEDEIWGEIINRLSFGGWEIKGKRIKAPLEALAEPERFDREILDLREQIKRHEKELEKIRRSNQNLDDAFDDPEFKDHKRRLLRKLNRNKDEWLRISSLIDEAKEKIKETEEARDNQKSLQDFLTKNKRTMVKLRDELLALAPEDKKTLIEGMIDEKIRIGLTWEGDELRWARLPFKLRFNKAILKRFIAEGRLKSFPKNAKHDLG